LWAFAVALAIAGAAIGVGMTSAYTSGGRLLPRDAHATGFGVLTTASLVGLAVSPIVAGFISGPGLRVVFEADVVLLIGLAVVAWMRMDARVTHPVTAVSDTSAS
jgi:MFS family permease